MGKIGSSRRTRWSMAFWLTTIVCVFGAASAFGDVITGPPPEDDCPDGSRGTNCRGFGHGSDTCTPRSCSRNEDCDDGETCENTELCIDEVECGIEGDAGPNYADHVAGSCEDGESCSSGTCQTREVCLTAPVFNSAGGCGCSFVNDRSPRSWVAMLVRI